MRSSIMISRGRSRVVLLLVMEGVPCRLIVGGMSGGNRRSRSGNRSGGSRRWLLGCGVGLQMRDDLECLEFLTIYTSPGRYISRYSIDELFGGRLETGHRMI